MLLRVFPAGDIGLSMENYQILAYFAGFEKNLFVPKHVFVAKQCYVQNLCVATVGRIHIDAMYCVLSEVKTITESCKPKRLLRHCAVTTNMSEGVKCLY